MIVMVYSEDKVYVGAVGVKLVVDTKVDLTSATDAYLEVRKPDGTVVVWRGTIKGRTIEYVIQEGDLDQAGWYLIQVFAEFGTETKYLGATDGIYIYERFE